MARRNYFLLMAGLAFCFVILNPKSYGWPFGAAKEKKSQGKASPKTESKAVPLSDNTSDAVSEESEEEEMPPIMPDLPPIPAALSQDPEIIRIRKQIQDIMKINEDLKASYAGQAAEIQRVSEQAKIHQRILQDLEVAKKQQQAARPTSEAFLNQEKIRLIQKETEKNRKFLETLQGQDLSKTVKPISMQDQESQKS